MSKFNDKVLSELLSNQLKKVDKNKKLDYKDMKRLSKYLPKSIFQKDTCVIWNGYITNKDNIDKGVYINFYYRNKKYALHRLLYINFIGILYDDEYLRFTCENKGCCCNINHFYNFHSFVELKCVISFCLNFIALKYYLLSCSRLLTCLYFLRLIRYYRKFIDNELLILALPHKIYH